MQHWLPAGPTQIDSTYYGRNHLCREFDTLIAAKAGEMDDLLAQAAKTNTVGKPQKAA